MINKKNIIIFSILIFITIIFILVILDIYYFKWHDNIYFLSSLDSNKQNTYQKTKFDFAKIDQLNNQNIESTNKTEQTEINKIIPNKNQPNQVNIKTNENKKTNNEIYSKGSSLPDQKYHSYGEYVSEAEKKYRQELVNNLRIKTVIIDKLTKRNGISQEYFKVAYINNMIPAKILEKLVESEEFRNLIPKKFLNREIEINGLPKGEIVVIKNEDINEILVLWTLGRLTPIQKAWSVHAIK